VIKQYAVSGGVFCEDRFVHPKEFSVRQVRDLMFATLDEAKRCAREYHEQFGDAFAVWFRDRQVGVHGTRGYVPLDPEFK